jgi:hypothetical protein
MKLHYDSPEACTRQRAVASLANAIDAQMKLLVKMRSGDGRTTEFREITEQSNRLEKVIQACIATIINPEPQKKAA